MGFSTAFIMKFSVHTHRWNCWESVFLLQFWYALFWIMDVFLVPVQQSYFSSSFVCGNSSFNIFVENSFPQFRYLAARLAPSVWLEVARAKTPNLGYFWYPSIEYVLFALILSGIVLSLLILWKVRHMEFHWENEDI